MLCHTINTSVTTTVAITVNHHPVSDPFSLVSDIIITMNGIVYQWNKEQNMEILVQNTSTVLKPASKLLIYTVTLQVTI